MKKSLVLRPACLTGPWSLSVAVSAADAQLSVNHTRPDPAISPYIYSQFNEHLGKESIFALY
jgi:hypothetical protein